MLNKVCADLEVLPLATEKGTNVDAESFFQEDLISKQIDHQTSTRSS